MKINLIPKKTFPLHVSPVCEEAFRAPKRVQQAPGPSPKVDSAVGSGHHQAGMSASARTVRRRLLEDGVVSRRAAKKPLLPRKNIRDRLIFCKRYRAWTAEDWGKVIFSDESPFGLFGVSGGKKLCWVHGQETPHTLNPIENLWSILKRRVGKQKPTNFDKVQALIMQEWAAISQDVAQKWIERMPEVLNKKGQHCKYWLFAWT